MPPFEFYTLDRDTLIYSDLEECPLMIIYFNTRCDFCQYEMQEIIARSEEFSKIQILFVSAERDKMPLDSLNKHFGLSYNTDMGIYRCSYQKITEWFGEMVSPTVLIYDKKGALINKFKGAMRINDILNEVEKVKHRDFGT